MVRVAVQVFALALIVPLATLSAAPAGGDCPPPGHSDSVAPVLDAVNEASSLANVATGFLQGAAECLLAGVAGALAVAGGSAAGAAILASFTLPVSVSLGLTAAVGAGVLYLAGSDLINQARELWSAASRGDVAALAYLGGCLVGGAASGRVGARLPGGRGRSGETAAPSSAPAIAAPLITTPLTASFKRPGEFVRTKEISEYLFPGASRSSAGPLDRRGAIRGGGTIEGNIPEDALKRVRTSDQDGLVDLADEYADIADVQAGMLPAARRPLLNSDNYIGTPTQTFRATGSKLLAEQATFQGKQGTLEELGFQRTIYRNLDTGMSEAVITAPDGTFVTRERIVLRDPTDPDKGVAFFVESNKKFVAANPELAPTLDRLPHSTGRCYDCHFAAGAGGYVSSLAPRTTSRELDGTGGSYFSPENLGPLQNRGLFAPVDPVQ